MENHFERIAIINRGEAAIRLIQAVCELNHERQLNLSTVALFTEPDRQAMFVREADDAVCIGPSTFLDPRDGQRKSSYLDPERIEQAMSIAQVDIAWVGCSPLAEEAWFADLCKRLGVVFVGPNAETLRLLGNKTSARQLAQQANIPIYLTEFLNRMIDGAHRLEVQVIADTFGTTWAVGVHDCTIQRHGQKLLEASRSQVLLPKQEHEVREAAVRLCQLANYQSAGSIEFLYDSVKREFWFLRFNSFLSTAHPLIEVSTGLDLVKLQLDLACGGHLVGEPPASTCHAIEIHLYPENMDKGLASRSGRLEVFRLANGPGIRIDTGYEEGDTVHAEFGPKLAQITAWGRDRQETLARLSRALSESRVVIRAGMSNKSLLLDLLNHPELTIGEADVLWFDRLRSGEAQGSRKYASIALLQAAVEVYNTEQRLAEAEFYASAAHGRPRVRQSADFPTHFQYRGLVYKLKVSRLGPQQYRVTTSRQSIEIQVERLGVFERRLTCFGRRYRILALTDGPDCYVEVEGIPYRITHEEGGLVRSPAPAVVVSVTVTPGDHVNKGDRLAFVETMKIDMAITAPFPGIVVQVFVTSNVPVDMGAPLVHIEPSEWVNTYTDTEPIQFVDAAYTARPNDEAPRERCHRIFDALRYQILGYDFDPSDSKQLLSEQSTIYNLMAPDDHELLREENEILSIFADICVLFRRELDPAESHAQEEQVHSAEHDLLTYLRSRDTRLERLPNIFLANLRRALAHYDVKSLEPSPELDASLHLMYKSHEHINQQLAAIIAILQRRLEHAETLAFSASGEMHILLDRLLLSTQGRYPAVNGLAYEIRFRYFNKPLFERARNKVYEEMQMHLAYLARHRTALDRDERMSILVACPQPLQNVLTSRFPQSEDEMRQLMLEVLTRRYYRIRKLEDLESTSANGQTFVKAAYEYEGAHIVIVTTFARYEDLAVAVMAMSRFVKQFPDEHDIVIDFYLWRSTPLSDAETTEQEVHMILSKTNFSRRLSRIVVAVNAPGKGLGMASTQHFTYHPGDPPHDKSGGYEEDRLYRGLHPMMGERLHIWQLANFHIERLPSVEDVYLFHGIAIDNPKDERLFALAEVRDMSPLRDESGKILQIPHLERMLMEALESMRQYQFHLPVHKRLPWNRVLLYIWPPLGLLPEEFLELMRKLWPFTEGPGLEKIVVNAKIEEPGTRELHNRILHISNPGGRELVLRESEPIEKPISTLGEYEQKVVQLRQRGLVYPYEIIEMLTPEPEGIRTPIPPGNFIEYDLDEDNRLVAIDRPYGENRAGIVVGIIRNYTHKYTEGMMRVILLGDPSHNLGSIAEPECRRIIEAINLAERLQVPVEWFTFSAGARISMESGTENMDWVARTLRRIIEFTQGGGEINVIVNGINVGAQPYWNAASTMLMNTHGILIMTPDGAMVLTGKQSLDYSGGVSAEDNYGIGGYEQIMGPNGQAQYFALDLSSACQILMRHYDHTYVLPSERFPRRAQTQDPITRDVRDSPYFSTRPEDSDLTCVGDLFSDERNAGRKHPFDIRTVMWALIDADHQPLERWHDMHGADTVVVWDVHIGGYPVAMLGIESRPIPRRGFVPGDGPEQWTAGTLFPMSSKKAARAINSASGNRPLVVIANLSGFDGSPESLRNLQLEYGAEIGRAITNFKGPLIFCVISRYHGGAFVDFSKALNENLETAAVEGSYASVIGGVPAAAVVFIREVDARLRADPRIKDLQEQLAQATGIQKAALQIKLKEVTASVHAEKVGEIASEFDNIHTVQRAKDVGSIDHIVSPATLRPYLIEAVERGIQRTQAILRQRTDIQTNQTT